MTTRPPVHRIDSVGDRLAGLRAPLTESTTAKKSPVRIELILGVVLVAGGVLVALSLGRHGDAPAPQGVVEQAIVDAATAPVEEIPHGGLLADETVVAVALEAGQFPPDLAPGDMVMVTVVPDFDTGGEVRSLESMPTVVAVSAPDDIGSRWVVTLRANRAVPKVLAGAKSVVLSVVGGAA